MKDNLKFMSTKNLKLEFITNYLDDKKAWNILILDLRGITSVSDFFIIANGSNKPHLKSLNEGLVKIIKENDFNEIGRSGTIESGWMIVDVDGIMIHLFEEDCRNYYNLEELWSDAKRLKMKVIK